MAPFVYLLFLAFYMLTNAIIPEQISALLGKIFTVPVYLFACLLGLGRLLKLCQWYIAACLLPLIPKAISYIDSYLVTMWYEEVVLINALTGLGYLIFLFFAYRHFFGCHGREEGTA